jgi:hypothetical protein
MPNINEVKKMKNTEKITQELLLLLLQYLKIQVAAQSIKLEELKHWAEMPCDCTLCEEGVKKVDVDEKETSFSQDFKEEWE